MTPALVLSQWVRVVFTDATGRDPDPRVFLWGMRDPAGAPLAVELAVGGDGPAACLSLSHQPITLSGPGAQMALDLPYLPLLVLGESPDMLQRLAQAGETVPVYRP